MPGSEARCPTLSSRCKGYGLPPAVIVRRPDAPGVPEGDESDPRHEADAAVGPPHEPHHEGARFEHEFHLREVSRGDYASSTL
jgi:hypothetical protein